MRINDTVIIIMQFILVTDRWAHWCQKQAYLAGISNCIPQTTVESSYLSLPEIPDSGTSATTKLDTA